MSAPLDHLAQRARVGVLGVALLARIHLLLAAAPDHAERSVTMMFSTGRPMSTSRSRQASAAAPAPEATSLTSLELLADEPQPVEHRGADDDRGAVLVVVEDRDLHALAQLAFDRRSIRAP